MVGLGGAGLLGLSRNTQLGVARWGWIGVVSTLFFGAPAILLDAVSGAVSSVSVTVLFAITPVVVVLAVANSAWGTREESNPQRLLVPSLAGVGGVLCMLPFSLPASTGEFGAIAVALAAVVAAGVAGAWLHQLSQSAPTSEVAAIVGFSNAALLLIWCELRGELVWRLTGFLPGEAALILVRAIAIVLTLWLVREMEPIRLSARYLAIPLLTIVEGFVAMRPLVPLRLIVGIVLLSVGTWWILAAKTEGEDKLPSLR